MVEAQPLCDNGYRFRQRKIIAAQPSPEQVTGFLLLVSETQPELRSVANGGLVESPLGHDIRFEDAGGAAQLPHRLEHYDPVSGTIIAWVRIPSWQLDQQLALLMFVGKAGLVASEADAAAAYRDYLVAWDTRTGVDLTGQGRSLAMTNVGAAIGIGDAGGYAGNSVGAMAKRAYWAELSSLTFQAIVRADAAMPGSSHGIFTQGPASGSDSTAGVTLQYLDNSSAGPNVVHFKVLTTDGAAFVLSQPDRHTTALTHYAGTWQTGQQPKLYIDGVLEEPGHGASRGGWSVAMDGGFLGAGARDTPAGGWQGMIDEVRVRPIEISAGHLAAEYLSYTDPALFYGSGAFDEAGDASQSPVAVPQTATTPRDTSILVDVLGDDSNPDGQAIVLESVSEPTPSGATGMESGQVRFTPADGFSGNAEFTYTMGDGVKRSTAKVRVLVTTESAGTPELPTPLRSIPVADLGELNKYIKGTLADFGAPRPGDQVTLAANDYGGDVVFSASGAEDAPIVIKGPAPVGPVTPEELTVTWSSGSLSIDGDHVTLWGIKFKGGGLVIDGADNLRVVRCMFREKPGNNAIIVNHLGGDDVLFTHCLWRILAKNTRGYTCKPANGVRRPTFRRCHFKGDPGFSAGNTATSEALQLGQGFNDNLVPLAALIDLCLFEHWTYESEIVSVKSSGNTVRNSTVRHCGTRGCIMNRHGQDNVYSGIGFENNNAANGGIITTDHGGLVLGCKSQNDGGQIRCFAGTVMPGAMTSSSQHPATRNCRIVACEMPVVEGTFHSLPNPTVMTLGNGFFANTPQQPTIGPHSGGDMQVDPSLPADIVEVPLPLFLAESEVGLGFPWDL